MSASETDAFQIDTNLLQQLQHLPSQAKNSGRQFSVCYLIMCKKNDINDQNFWLVTVRDSGKFQTSDYNRGLEPDILNVVVEEPNITIRWLTFSMGISTFIVWWSLCEQRLHPYYLERVQALKLMLPSG
mgnify:CR=1 FL=1